MSVMCGSIFCILRDSHQPPVFLPIDLGLFHERTASSDLPSPSDNYEGSSNEAKDINPRRVLAVKPEICVQSR